MNIYTVLPLVASVALLFLGGYVIGKKPGNHINQVWALLCFCLALWSFGTFVLFSSADKEVALSWLKLYNLGAVLVPAAFLHFVTVFSRDNSKVGKATYLFAYATSAVFFFLGFTDLFNKGVEYHYWGYYPFPGPANVVFDLLFGVFLIVALIKLVSKYRQSVGRQRNQYKYIFLAGVISFGTCLTNFLPIYKIDVYPIGQIGVLFGGVIISSAIIKYRLMDIDLIVRKSVIYSALTALVASSYVGTVLVLQTVFKGLTGYNSLLAAVIVSLVIALTFEPVHRSIQLFIDKTFFKRKYEYQQVISSASEDFKTQVSTLETSAFLIDTVTESLHSTKSWIMVINRRDSHFITMSAYSLPDSIKHSLSFSTNSKIVEMLTNRSEPLYFDDQENTKFRRKVDRDELSIIGQLGVNVVIPLKGKNGLVGMLFLGEKKSGESYNQDDIELLVTLCNQAAVSIENAHLYEDLQESYLNTVKSLVTALEAKDEYTKGHSERVARYAKQIALEFGFSQPEAQLLYEVSLLHDVGKIGVSEQILNKPSQLTNKEFDQIRTHSVIGERILSAVESLRGGLSAVRHHHERLNGDGYPDGLSQLDIPLQARILSVADAYDAMITRRPYRPAMKPEEAIEELKRHSCEQFDPKVVRAFLVVLARNRSRKYRKTGSSIRLSRHLRSA
jgi:HD-GYP domain-containing protein (c-di-GMP phosphodiesterase class II)